MTPRDPLLDLFPPGTTVGGSGALEIGGCDTMALAHRFGTPAFVVDEGALRAQTARFRDGLERRRPRSRVVFASKAYPSVAVLRVFAEEGLGCDVVGRGELEIAMAAGMDPGLVLMHGNAKSDDDIAAALRHGIGTVVVDGSDDLDRLERLAIPGRPQGVLIRVIPGVDAATHEKILTGHDDSKFGLSPADAATAIERARRSPHLRQDGLHVHLGSQIVDLDPFAMAVEAAAALGTFAVYDVGGGLGVAYAPGDEAPTVEAYLDATVAAADRCLPPEATLIIEPGRSLVAEAGVTLYRVVTVKRSEGAKTFVAVDGGMGDNLEAMFYDVGFAATIVNRTGAGGETVDLVGRHCESGDVLITGVALNEPRVGDVIAVPVTGAYCFTMANNYNGALRPPVVFVADGVATEMVRRETYDDLLVRELTAVGPADPVADPVRPAPAGTSPSA